VHRRRGRWALGTGKKTTTRGGGGAGCVMRDVAGGARRQPPGALVYSAFVKMLASQSQRHLA
jgi:hypothetical protein